MIEKTFTWSSTSWRVVTFDTIWPSTNGSRRSKRSSSFAACSWLLNIYIRRVSFIEISSRRTLCLTRMGTSKLQIWELLGFGIQIIRRTLRARQVIWHLKWCASNLTVSPLTISLWVSSVMNVCLVAVLTLDVAEKKSENTFWRNKCKLKRPTYRPIGQSKLQIL